MTTTNELDQEPRIGLSDLTVKSAVELPLSFNAWFISLPEGRQAILREDKWMLAQAAFDAGINLGTAYALAANV